MENGKYQLIENSYVNPYIGYCIKCSESGVISIDNIISNLNNKEESLTSGLYLKGYFLGLEYLNKNQSSSSNIKIYEYVEGNYVEKSLLEETELGKAYWFKIDEDYIFNFEF